MIGIRYKEQFLDIAPGTALGFEWNNTVFTTADASLLPGSFSFPFDLPATPHNRALLGHPDRPDNAAAFFAEGTAQVYLRGAMFFEGRMKVTEAGPQRIRVNFVANPLLDLKDKTLSDLDYEGLHEGPPILGGTWAGHMKDTALYPEEYQHVFFPVFTNYNRNYVFSLDNYSLFYNAYDVNTQTFKPDDGAAVIPFVKLKYILERIFTYDNTGFNFTNAWQIDTETSRLYVWSNRDARTTDNNAAPEMRGYFLDYRHLVPTGVKVTDFFRAVCAQHCLGLFNNAFSRSARLVPLDTLFDRPATTNWTDKVVSEPTVEPPSNTPGSYNYSQPGSLPPDAPAVADAPQYETIAQPAGDIDTAHPYDGDIALGDWFYVESENSLLRYIRQIISPPPGTPGIVTDSWFQHQGVEVGEGDPFDPGIGCMPCANGFYHYDGEMSQYEEVEDENGDMVWRFQQRDTMLALLYYRGIQPAFGSTQIPYAQNSAWKHSTTTPDRSAITTGGTSEGDAARSLNWHGPYGLYQVWHRRWSEMLRNGKYVTVSLRLTVADLINFSFENRVRIGNMEYFVKRLRINATPRGLAPVEAELISVI